MPVSKKRLRLFRKHFYCLGGLILVRSLDVPSLDVPSLEDRNGPAHSNHHHASHDIEPQVGAGVTGRKEDRSLASDYAYEGSGGGAALHEERQDEPPQHSAIEERSDPVHRLDQRAESAGRA